jgi:hypothetical protein
MTRTIVLLATLGISSASCAINRRTPAKPAEIAELWTEPTDLEKRDLFHGPGGPGAAPSQNRKYRFLALKASGTQPGYDVEESGTGVEWSAKFGVEARTEVTVSRIVWAVGYHQPHVYYMPRWTLVDSTGKESEQAGARFRREGGAYNKTAEWSWRDNPFVGSRELAGLFTLMVMFNNWDIKRSQNTVYEVKNGNGNGDAQMFVVRDLGASLGESKWLSFGSKDDPEGFDREEFIRSTEGNRVQFAFEGSWLVPQMLNSVTPADVRWISRLLTRLSDKQWHDAFRAGGFTRSEADRYIRRLKAKIDEGLAAGKS